MDTEIDLPIDPFENVFKPGPEPEPEPEPELELEPTPSRSRKRKSRGLPRLPTKKPKPVEEDPIVRQRLLSTLCEYRDNSVLGPFLEKRKFDLQMSKLNGMNNDILRAMLGQVECALGSTSVSPMIDSTVKYGLGITEMLMCKKVANIKGFSDNLFNDAQWRFLYERVKMKHAGFDVNLDPLSQLLLSTMNVLVMTYKNNALMPKSTLNFDMEAPKRNSPTPKKKNGRPTE